MMWARDAILMHDEESGIGQKGVCELDPSAAWPWCSAKAWTCVAEALEAPRGCYTRGDVR